MRRLDAARRNYPTLRKVTKNRAPAKGVLGERVRVRDLGEFALPDEVNTRTLHKNREGCGTRTSDHNLAARFNTNPKSQTQNRLIFRTFRQSFCDGK
jgi:hypothetical protein